MKIIPGLPNDIGRQCLLRVPCTSHYKLSLVCKRWKNIVCSPLFYQDRKMFGMSQEFIILPCWEETDYNVCRIKLYDPLQNSFETLPPFPPEFPYFFRCSYCVPFNHKLFVVGFLTEWPEFTIHKPLFIYDFTSGRWKRGPDLPDSRDNFCCSVDSAKGLIYIGGGRGSDEEALDTAIVYDIEEEQWEYLPPMLWSEDESRSMFIDDKLYVVGYVSGLIQAYHPNTRQWTAMSSCYGCGIQPALVNYDYFEEIIERDHPKIQFRPYPELLQFIGATMWHQKILIVGVDMKAALAFYLFEPSIPGEHGEARKKDNWTLISTLSLTEFPDAIDAIGALTL